MATGDKIVNLDDLKAVHDFTQGQVGALKSALGDLYIDDFNVPTSTAHYLSFGAKAIGATLGDIEVGSNNWNYYRLHVESGDQFVITGTGGNDPSVWALTDEGTTPSAEDWSDKGCKLLAKGGRNASLENYIITVEQDGWLLANQKIANTFSLKKEVPVANQTAELRGRVATLTDFGTAGDGATDDTAAIKQALTACAGKTLYVPAGTYLFSETLEIKSGTRIIGCGESSVFKLANTYTLTPYSWRPEDEAATSLYKWPMVHLSTDTNGVTIENIKIVGQTNAFVDEADVCLAVQGSNHCIHDVTITDINYFPSSFSGRTYNAPGEGIEMFKASNVSVENCVMARCGYEGIGTEDSTDIVIRNCYVGDTNQTGVQVHRSSNRVLIEKCVVKYSADTVLAGSALTLHANVGVAMDNVDVYSNYFCKGVTCIGGAENGIRLIGNTIEDGGLTNSGRIYRNNWIISHNRFNSGGITFRCDEAIVTENMVTVNTGYNMITIRGNKAIAVNNVALGSVSGVYIETHE